MRRYLGIALWIATVIFASNAIATLLPARSSWGSTHPSCRVNTSARLITISAGCHAWHVIVPKGTRVTYR